VGLAGRLLTPGPSAQVWFQELHAALPPRHRELLRGIYLVRLGSCLRIWACWSGQLSAACVTSAVERWRRPDRTRDRLGTAACRLWHESPAGAPAQPLGGHPLLDVPPQAAGPCVQQGALSRAQALSSAGSSNRKVSQSLHSGAVKAGGLGNQTSQPCQHGRATLNSVAAWGLSVMLMNCERPAGHRALPPAALVHLVHSRNVWRTQVSGDCAPAAQVQLVNNLEAMLATEFDAGAGHFHSVSTMQTTALKPVLCLTAKHICCPSGDEEYGDAQPLVCYQPRRNLRSTLRVRDSSEVTSGPIFVALAAGIIAAGLRREVPQLVLDYIGRHPGAA
jgi:hypothetical protein